MATAELPSVAYYVDYRAYLKDFYTHQKQRNTNYSYRLFAMRAKLSSPNYLKLVIDGQRRVTDKNLPAFVRGLKLNAHEAEYFRNLVFYQEAKDPEAKSQYLYKVMSIRQRLTQHASRIEKDKFEFLRDVRHLVIHEMILLDDFKNDPEWIANRLETKASVQDVRFSLQLLERLGFVEKTNTPKGYKTKASLITTATGDKLSSLLLNNIHRQFLNSAITSMMNKPNAAWVNGLTIAISKERLPQMKEAIRTFRQELNRKFSQPDGNDEVYHISFAVFPLTKGGSK